MIARLSPPLLAILLVMVLAAAPGQAQNRRGPSPYGGSCSVTGKISLTTKLSCPGEPVRIEVVLKPQCQTDSPNPVSWRKVRVTLPLPTSVRPLDPPRSYQPEQNPMLERTFNVVPGRGMGETLAASWWVRSMEAGSFILGEGAEAKLEDDRGNLISAKLDPVTLNVSEKCLRPTTARLYLPLLRQPRCMPAESPADIVLLLDQSSSLRPQELALAGEQARTFLDALDLRRDRVAVIAFDQNVRLLAPLGSPRPALDRALDELRLTPGTRIDRALQAAIDELTGPRGRNGRRRTIALLTDGVNTNPHGDQPVLDWGGVARSKGITVVTVAIGVRPNLALLDALADKPELSLSASNSDELESAYRALADVTGCDWYDG